MRAHDPDNVQRLSTRQLYDVLHDLGVAASWDADVRPTFDALDVDHDGIVDLGAVEAVVEPLEESLSQTRSRVALAHAQASTKGTHSAPRIVRHLQAADATACGYISHSAARRALADAGLALPPEETTALLQQASAGLTGTANLKVNWRRLVDLVDAPRGHSSPLQLQCPHSDASLRRLRKQRLVKERLVRTMGACAPVAAWRSLFRSGDTVVSAAASESGLPRPTGGDSDVHDDSLHSHVVPDELPVEEFRARASTLGAHFSDADWRLVAQELGADAPDGRVHMATVLKAAGASAATVRGAGKRPPLPSPPGPPNVSVFVNDHGSTMDQFGAKWGHSMFSKVQDEAERRRDVRGRNHGAYRRMNHVGTSNPNDVCDWDEGRRRTGVRRRWASVPPSARRRAGSPPASPSTPTRPAVTKRLADGSKPSAWHTGATPARPFAPYATTADLPGWGDEGAPHGVIKSRKAGFKVLTPVQKAEPKVSCYTVAQAKEVVDPNPW